MFSLWPLSNCTGLRFPHHNCNTIASPFLSKLCLCLVISLISQVAWLCVLQKLSKMLLNDKFSKPWHCKQAAEHGYNFIQTAATQSTKSRSLHQTSNGSAGKLRSEDFASCTSWSQGYRQPFILVGLRILVGLCRWRIPDIGSDPVCGGRPLVEVSTNIDFFASVLLPPKLLEWPIHSYS